MQKKKKFFMLLNDTNNLNLETTEEARIQNFEMGAEFL